MNLFGLLDLSGSAMTAERERAEVVTSNLANVNTSGYIGADTTFHSLLASARGLQNPLNRAINHFDTLSGTRLQLANGSLQRTDNAFDFAIEGEGFFAVQTPAGTMYTRNGGFQLSAQRQLTTADGDLVLGDQGPITLPAGKISVSADGTISVDGAVAGKMRIVEFQPGADIQPLGRSLYSARSEAARPSKSSAVRQGMIASSNVNPVTALVGLINVQRNADMLQRALSEFYGDFNRIAVEDLPRV